MSQPDPNPLLVSTSEHDWRRLVLSADPPDGTTPVVYEFAQRVFRDRHDPYASAVDG
jgi:hypothetical protein